MQGQTGQLQITGSNLSGLTPSQFVFSPAGIMPDSWAIADDSAGVLAVTVAGDAPVASYLLRPGAGPALPNAVSVRPRPQAVSCDTLVINQQMTLFTATITVSGQALQSATAQLTTAEGGLISFSSPTPAIGRTGRQPHGPCLSPPPHTTQAPTLSTCPAGSSVSRCQSRGRSRPRCAR